MDSFDGSSSQETCWLHLEWTKDKRISCHCTIATAPYCQEVMESAPPSPSVFLDLPPTPHDDSQQPQDDLALEYISRVLMEEEDIADKLLYPDHPTLLQAQQSFAEILSNSGTSTYDALEPSPPGIIALLPGQGSSMMHIQNPAFFLNGTDTVVDANSSLFPGESRSTSMHVMSSMAFFKGIEEANSFLPVDNTWKKRFNGDGEAEAVEVAGRRSKQMAGLDSEEAAVREMMDQIMLDGYNLCPGEKREISGTVEVDKKKKKAERQQQQSMCWTKALRGRQVVAVADLETQLIRCAEAVSTNDRRNAGELLERIKRCSSPTGDATQRLAHYFAEGLEARLAGKGSRRPTCRGSFMTKHASTVEHLKASQLYMAASCFIQVAFLFANKSIFNAVEGKKKLHVVHYGIDDGFQWPELLRWLADREGGPPEVRITGIDRPQPGFRPAERIEEAGRRLKRCASQLGVPFKFRAIAAKSEAVRAEDLGIEPDEVLTVNNMFHFWTLMDESLIGNRLNPRDLVLNTIREMKPSVFVHVVLSRSYSSAFFVTRFREALYNFAAQFDVMEAVLPRGSGKRLLVERDVFAPMAVNIIACEGADRFVRPQNYREWQARNRRAGLRQLPLDPSIVQMLKDRVKKQYHKHFVINEDQQWLLQGWKGRVLYALSTWVADDASNSEVT